MNLFNHLRPYILLVVLLTSSIIVMANGDRPFMWNIRAQTLKLVWAIEYRFSWATEILFSVRENRNLRVSNLQLSSELTQLRIAGHENEQLRQALGWKQEHEFETISARIIAREPLADGNFFTIDVGSTQGVDVSMAVISHMGILGRIVHVSREYSQVMPYLHSKFHVPVMIDTLGSVGIISGKGSTPDSLVLHDVVKTEPIQLGQRVITHEASGVFPPHLLVGTIADFSSEPSGNFWMIKVKPSAPLHKTHFAFVVLTESNRPPTFSEAPLSY